MWAPLTCGQAQLLEAVLNLWIVRPSRAKPLAECSLGGGLRCTT